MKKYKSRGIDFGGLSLTDPEKYRKIYDVLSERGVKEDLLDIVDTVPLEEDGYHPDGWSLAVCWWTVRLEQTQQGT